MGFLVPKESGEGALSPTALPSGGVMQLLQTEVRAGGGCLSVAGYSELA